MSNYLTTTNVTDRMGAKKAAELTADTGTSPDLTKIGLIIDEQEGVANSSLSRAGYKTPIDTATHADVVDLLRGKTYAMVAYQMYLLRGAATDDIRDENISAKEWLEDVATGEIVLPAETADPEDSATGKPQGTFGYVTRDASRESMKDL